MAPVSTDWWFRSRLDALPSPQVANPTTSELFTAADVDDVTARRVNYCAHGA
jgi:hypothetical protein